MELLELSAFELEYHNRAKLNLFSEKWKNCTLTKSRQKKLKNYLYHHIKIILFTENSKDFYEITLKPFIHHEYYSIMDNFKTSKESGEKNLLYRMIYFKHPLEDLFILLTNVIAWEHQNYPALLENALLTKYCEEYEEGIQKNDDLLLYYIRFLDILSSDEIISLFDLDSLKFTIKRDFGSIGIKPLESLFLFTDWPVFNSQTFFTRFPTFRENLSKKIAMQ